MSTERNAGLQALQQNNFTEAVSLLESACLQDPNDFEAHLYLGVAYGQAGRPMDAITSATKAVQLQPSNAQARYNLGIAMERGGYREQAVTALQQAVTLQPDYQKARDAIARLSGGNTAGASLSGTLGTQPQQQAAAPARPYGGVPAEGSAVPAFGFGEAQAPQAAPPTPAPAYSFLNPAPGPQQPPVNSAPGAQPAPYGAPTANPYGTPATPYTAPAANPYSAPSTPYGASPSPYAPPPTNQWTPPAGSNPYPTPAPYSGGYALQGRSGQGQYVEYADFWPRFAAALIDGAILLIPNIVVNIAILAAVGATAASSNSSEPNTTAGGVGFLAIMLASLVVPWLYNALMESSSLQGSVGKLALGIKVTDLNGNPIGFLRATGRHFGKLLSGMFFCIGYLMAAFTERKQALHDQMASCLVVKR